MAALESSRRSGRRGGCRHTPFIEEHVGLGAPNLGNVTTSRSYPIIAVVPLCVAGAYVSGVVAGVRRSWVVASVLHDGAQIISCLLYTSDAADE